MTVAASTNRVSYSGNGSTTAFAFSFPFRATSDLVVTVRTTATGAESLQTEGTHYTVTGTPTSDAGGFASGTVTFGTAPASGTQVHIDREPARTQTTDYIAGDGIPPSSIEGSLDRLTLLVQDLESRLGRTLMQPRTAAYRRLVLPEPSSSTANKVLTVNAGGTGYEVRSTTATLPGLLNVRDYGAVGDGVADDTAAINATFNQLRALVDEGLSTDASYFIEFPPGKYRVTSSINATAIRNRKWGIRGPGQIVAAFTSSYPVLDFTHSFSGAIRDLFIVTAAGFTPGIGLLLSRDDSGAVASGHLIDMVSIIGSFSIAPVYNYGCEDVLFIRSTFNNQSASASAYGGVFDGTNSLGASSPFRTIPANTAVSFNDVSLFATEFLRPSGGPTVFLRRTTGLSMRNCYAATTSGSSIIVNSDGYAHVGLYLGIHCETSGLEHCVEFTGAATQTISGFTFVDYGPQASVSVFKSGSGVSSVTLRNADIRIDSFQVAPSSNLFSTASVFSIYGGRVYINDNTYNNITSLAAFTGIIETNTLGRFVARTSFDVNGTKVVGARDTGWTAMTGTTNKATSYDTSTVTLAQLAGRVMAIQAALTTHGLLGT